MLDVYAIEDATAAPRKPNLGINTRSRTSVITSPMKDASKSTFSWFRPRRYMERTRAMEKVTMPGRRNHTAHALSANAAPKNTVTRNGAKTASTPPATTVRTVTTRQTISVRRSASCSADEATRGARTIPAALARYQTISARPVPTA